MARGITPEEAAGEVAGFDSWGAETIMALDPAAADLDPDAAPDVRPVADAREAAAIVRAQADAGLRPHPVTQAHADDPRMIQRWVSVDGAVAAFALVALVGWEADLAAVTALPARRRGYAGVLMRRLLADARVAGAERGVPSATAMAYPRYRSLGFEDVTPLVGFSVGSMLTGRAVETESIDQ